MAIAGAARSVTAKCKLTVSVNFAHPPGAAPDLRLRRGSSVASAATALMFLKCASKRRLKDFSPDNGTATEHDEGDQSLCLSAQPRFGSTQRVRSCPIGCVANRGFHEAATCAVVAFSDGPAHSTRNGLVVVVSLPDQNRLEASFLHICTGRANVVDLVQLWGQRSL